MKRANAPREVLQLRVVLRGIRPPVWRRLLVESDRTFDHLHAVLQRAFGWTESHLHDFELGGTRIAEPDPGFEDGSPRLHPRTTRLSDVLTDGVTRILYRYDFGDDWEHVVGVERLLPPDPAVRYPVCLGGARSGPPEDVGGVDGYERFLEILKDPEHEEHAEMQEWVGGSFDPEHFDLDGVNSILAQVRRPASRRG